MPNKGFLVVAETIVSELLCCGVGIVGTVLSCGYCLVSFLSFVLRHQETPKGNPRLGYKNSGKISKMTSCAKI